MQGHHLTGKIKAKAFALGFDFCRVIPIDNAPHSDFFAAWLAAGRAGEMTYLERHLEKRQNPGNLAEPDSSPFQSMIVLAVDYYQFELPEESRADPSRGIIASYAWGDDYHDIIRPQLYELDKFIRTCTGRQAKGKCLVDTGPVLERDWAMQAGIGFTGKNCCTIHPRMGSWLFLATMLIPEHLAYDPPLSLENALDSTAILQGLPPNQNVGTWEIPLADRRELTATGTCGQCTRCMEQCPTDAFVGPFHLDPARCISYWTIEAKDKIPRELRPHFGNRIFGCDICQDVCPWNRNLPERKPRLPGLNAQQDRVAPPLLEGFRDRTPYWLNREAFGAHFRRSPVKRTKRHGMLRNVCVALGNWADPITLPALSKAIQDEYALVRGHAAWALGKVLARHPKAVGAVSVLEEALATEDDNWVRAEIADALHQKAKSH